MFEGVRCETQCPAGRYGEQCSERCPCANNSSCDAGTGRCQCAAGWRGPHCDQPCPPNHYGAGCLQMCPESPDGMIPKVNLIVNLWLMMRIGLCEALLVSINYILEVWLTNTHY